MLNNIQIGTMETGFKPPQRGLSAEDRADTPPIMQKMRKFFVQVPLYQSRRLFKERITDMRTRTYIL